MLWVARLNQTADTQQTWMWNGLLRTGVGRGTTGATCSRHDEETDDECVGLPLKQGVFPKHVHHQQLV